MQQKVHTLVKAISGFYCKQAHHLSKHSVKHAFLCKPTLVFIPSAFYGTKTIQGLLDNAHRELFYLKPLQIEEPDPLKTELLSCMDADAVLELFLNLEQSDQPPDIAFLCISRIHSLVAPKNFVSEIRTQHFICPVEVLSDTRFHLLIERTLKTSFYLKSIQLAFLFNVLVRLGIPPSSCSLQHVIKTIQTRINYFFPRDVAMCTRALRSLKIVRSKEPLMKDLHQVLLLHLENLSVDEEFFVSSFKGTQILAAVDMALFFKGRASRDLRRCLHNAMKFILLEYQDEKQKLSLVEAIKLKQYLAHVCSSPLPHNMLRVATNAVEEHDIPEDKQMFMQQLESKINRKIEQYENNRIAID